MFFTQALSRRLRPRDAKHFNLAALVCLALAPAGLVACGDDDDDTTGDTSDTGDVVDAAEAIRTYFVFPAELGESTSVSFKATDTQATPVTARTTFNNFSAVTTERPLYEVAFTINGIQAGYTYYFDLEGDDFGKGLRIAGFNDPANKTPPLDTPRRYKAPVMVVQPNVAADGSLSVPQGGTWPTTTGRLVQGAEEGSERAFTSRVTRVFDYDLAGTVYAGAFEVTLDNNPVDAADTETVASQRFVFHPDFGLLEIDVPIRGTMKTLVAQP